MELLFKWIKQNLKIKFFLGTSENAIMTQVLVALCNYLLFAFIKFKSKIGANLQQIIHLLQANLFIRRPLLELIKSSNNDPPLDRQMRFALVRN